MGPMADKWLIIVQKGLYPVFGTLPVFSVFTLNCIICLELILLICFSRYNNVLILTTSNISGAIDLAFVDRADIKQYIGLPSKSAIYQIYLSCIKELTEVRTFMFLYHKYFDNLGTKKFFSLFPCRGTQRNACGTVSTIFLNPRWPLF